MPQQPGTGIAAWSAAGRIQGVANILDQRRVGKRLLQDATHPLLRGPAKKLLVDPGADQDHRQSDMLRAQQVDQCHAVDAGHAEIDDEAAMLGQVWIGQQRRWSIVQSDAKPFHLEQELERCPDSGVVVYDQHGSVIMRHSATLSRISGKALPNPVRPGGRPR